MKTTPLVILGLLLLTILPAQSKIEITFDYSWWNSLSEGQQAIAAEAAMSSYQAGYVRGVISAAPLESKTRELAFKKYPKFSHSIGYYVAAISDFYGMHPDGKQAVIGDIMGCLTDNPFESCADVAKYSQ